MRDADQKRAFDLRLRIQGVLKGLEDKDTLTQAEHGIQQLIQGVASLWEAEFIVKELLSGLESCNVSARKPRFRLASKIISYFGTGGISSSGQALIVKRILEVLRVETHDANVQELAGLVEEASAASLRDTVQTCTEGTGGGSDSGWLGHTLLQSLVQAGTRSPSKKTAGTAFILARAALKGFLESLHLAMVREATLACLKQMLRSLLSGQLFTEVPEVFLPVQISIELLGSELSPQTVKGIVQACLRGVTQKADWQMRKQAVETCAVLAASIQVHKPTETGEWRLEPSSGVQALATHKRELTAALGEAKYDKIVHVRQAAIKALAELECIPDGMGLCCVLPPQISLTNTAPPPDVSTRPRSREESRHRRSNSEATSDAGSETASTPAASPPPSRAPLKSMRSFGNVAPKVARQKPKLQGSPRRTRPFRPVPCAMDFGIQVYAAEPPPPPIPLPPTREELLLPAQQAAEPGPSKGNDEERGDQEAVGGDQHPNPAAETSNEAVNSLQADPGEEPVMGLPQTALCGGMDGIEILIPSSEPGAEPQRFIFKDGQLHPVLVPGDPPGNIPPPPSPTAGIIPDPSAGHAGPSPIAADSSSGPVSQPPQDSEVGRHIDGTHRNPISEPAASHLTHGSVPVGGIGGIAASLPSATAQEANLLMQLPALLASAVASGKSGAEVMALQQALVASAQREWEALAGLRGLPGPQGGQPGIGNPGAGRYNPQTGMPLGLGLPPQNLDWNAALIGQEAQPGGLNLGGLRTLQHALFAPQTASPCPAHATAPSFDWLQNLQHALTTPGVVSPSPASATAYGLPPSPFQFQGHATAGGLQGEGLGFPQGPPGGLQAHGLGPPQTTAGGLQGQALGAPHLPGQRAPPGVSNQQEQQAALLAQLLAAAQRGNPGVPNATQLGGTHAPSPQDPAVLLARLLASMSQASASPGSPISSGVVSAAPSGPMKAGVGVSAAHTQLHDHSTNPTHLVPQGCPVGPMNAGIGGSAAVARSYDHVANPTHALSQGCPVPLSGTAHCVAAVNAPVNPGVPGDLLHAAVVPQHGVHNSPGAISGKILPAQGVGNISSHVAEAQHQSQEASSMQLTGVSHAHYNTEGKPTPGPSSPRSPDKRAAPLAALLARMGALSSPRKSSLSVTTGQDKSEQLNDSPEAPGKRGRPSLNNPLRAAKGRTGGTHHELGERGSMEFGDEGAISPQIPVWWKSPQRAQAGDAPLEVVGRQNAAASLGNRPTFPGTSDGLALAVSPAHAQGATTRAGGSPPREPSTTRGSAGEPAPAGGSGSLRTLQVRTHKSQDSGMQTSPSILPALESLDEPSSPMVDVHINPLFSAENMASASSAGEPQPTGQASKPQAAGRLEQGSCAESADVSRGRRAWPASPDPQPVHPHTTGRSSALMRRTAHTPSHGTGLRRQASLSTLASHSQASPLLKRFEREGTLDTHVRYGDQNQSAPLLTRFEREGTLNTGVRSGDQNQSAAPPTPTAAVGPSHNEGTPLVRTASRLSHHEGGPLVRTASRALPGSGNDFEALQDGACELSEGSQLLKEVEAIHALNLGETEALNDMPARQRAPVVQAQLRRNSSVMQRILQLEEQLLKKVLECERDQTAVGDLSAQLHELSLTKQMLVDCFPFKGNP